jgi:hypothetical protein
MSAIRKFRLTYYLSEMGSAFEFCIPTAGKVVPSGPDWLHEVKYDGYRLRVERDGDRVRLFSRNGYDWTSRYPWIAEAARKIRQKRFVLDGEAVILGVDGLPTSTRFTPGSTITTCSSAPSISSWKAATISGSCRCTSANSPSAAISAPSRGHFRQPLRTGRDRS